MMKLLVICFQGTVLSWKQQQYHLIVFTTVDHWSRGSIGLSAVC